MAIHDLDGLWYPQLIRNAPCHACLPARSAGGLRGHSGKWTCFAQFVLVFISKMCSVQTSSWLILMVNYQRVVWHLASLTRWFVLFVTYFLFRRSLEHPWNQQNVLICCGPLIPEAFRLPEPPLVWGRWCEGDFTRKCYLTVSRCQQTWKIKKQIPHRSS